MKYQNSALGRFALTQIATALTLGVLSSSAWSLGLGRLSVQSALGETLKAEIDITSLSSEEAGTLKVRIAPPEVYRASGVEYNSVLPGTQVQTITRDGRSFLRVSSDRAVQEPFIDVILEMTWASGRLVREYTLLFDPPMSPRPVVAPPAVAAAPAISPTAPAATEPVPAPAPSVATALPPSRPAAPAPAPSRPRVEAPKPEVRAEVPAPAPRPPALAPSTAASEYTVKPGDTLSRIASKTQPAGVSLDQMLVGLYRNNQDAFIGSNMNRLKAGVVLQVPASEALTGVSSDEARQVIQAQSADFSAYRQRLAGVAPTMQQEGSERQATGKVQAAVEDRKPAATTTPDKLTLSKAASAAAEVKASKDTEKKDSAARVAELTRNVEELKKLSSAAKPVATPPVPAPVAAPAPAPAPVAVAAAPAPAPSAASAPQATPETVASAPVVVPTPMAQPASRPAAMPPPAPQPEPGLLDQLLDNPLVMPLGAVLLAGLAGLGWYRLRGRKGSGKADTGFHESRLQPDSFFGATGGQRVDTRDGSTGGGGASSMSYSLSQLDAIGDVDPVAEADVYLAYGRDLQAEEILKEALRANPERLAIRLKLLEVYAKRRDTKGFEQLAIQLYAETHGVGDDWGRAQELGRQIDAENPLYQPGGAPMHPTSGPDIHPEPMDASTLPQTVSSPGAHLSTEPLLSSRHGPDTSPSSDFGSLDLDLDLDSPPTTAATSPIAMEATQAMTTTVEQAPMSMDFELPTPTIAQHHQPAADSGDLDLQFDLNDFGTADEIPKTIAVAKPASARAADGALDFDLGSIDLDLPDLSGNAKTETLPVPEASSFDDPLSAATERPAESLDDLGGSADGEDPLTRQLELADEFRQIGDTEGAREVLQELIGKASGDLKTRAQAMLDSLR